VGAEPRVRVAVVTSNNAGVIPGLLAGLPAACTGVTWELVVADNNSADGTLAAVAASGFHGTVVRMSRNAGYAAGINAAAAVPGQSGGGQQTAGGSAAFDALMVMGPNVRLDRGAVARLWCRSSSSRPPGSRCRGWTTPRAGRSPPSGGGRP
jgi:N-acetylglucosaminyl-diphospho-decaprenol L-rhamnosyltransferase